MFSSKWVHVQKHSTIYVSRTNEWKVSLAEITVESGWLRHCLWGRASRSYPILLLLLKYQRCTFLMNCSKCGLKICSEAATQQVIHLYIPFAMKLSIALIKCISSQVTWLNVHFSWVPWTAQIVFSCSWIWFVNEKWELSQKPLFLGLVVIYVKRCFKLIGVKEFKPLSFRGVLSLRYMPSCTCRLCLPCHSLCFLTFIRSAKERKSKTS